MANPERDTVYTRDTTDRTVHTRESNGTGWFIGIIVALALLAIAYLVFSGGNNGAGTTTDVNNTTIESPVTDPATSPAPMTEAPATTDTTVTPMTETPAPATETAPAAGGDAGAAAPAAGADAATPAPTTPTTPAAQ